MKKLLVSLVLALLIVGMSQAQVKTYTQMNLFSTTACSTGGINSNFTEGGQNGTYAISATMTTLFPTGVADVIMIECSGVKMDDDSLEVYIEGIGMKGDTTAYLDTLVFSPTAGQSQMRVVTPWIMTFLSGTGAGTSGTYFPPYFRFHVANEDSGANFATPYFGVVADTNITRWRVTIAQDD